MTLPTDYTAALPAMSASATASGSDYKAIVNVMLLGGNDHHNTVIPTGAAYTEYASTRGALAFAQPTALTGQACGLNPNLAGLATIFNAGRASIVANVGHLAYPVTKAEIVAYQKMPLQLQDHQRQQDMWFTLDSDNPGAFTGVLGRFSDIGQTAFNTTSAIQMGTSIAGRSLIQVGNEATDYRITVNGPVPLTQLLTLNGLGYTNQAAMIALIKSADTSYTNIFQRELARELTRAEAAGTIVSSSIAAYTPTGFPATSLGNQLAMVGRMIAQRAAFGHRRDTFYVMLGGFDTHQNQLATHAALMTQLNDALVAWDTFVGSVNAVNMRNQITLYTASDFGRTKAPNNNAGFDHSWAGHHFVMGGTQLVGGKVFYKATSAATTYTSDGTFPDLSYGGPNDTGSLGLGIPTTSSSEYVAGILKWFGVPDAVSNGVNPMDVVFPYLSRMTTRLVPVVV